MSPRLGQLTFAFTFAAFLVLGTMAIARRRSDLAFPRSTAIGVMAFAAMGAVLRFAFVEPAFVHANFHGPALVESILSFPDPNVHRVEYGHGSFFVLGLAAATFGRTAETVFHANAIVAALTTVPLAFVAAHWAGRSEAAVYAAAAWATSPLVARLACSEDSHVVATALALAGLAAIELGSSLGSRSFLAAGVAATLAAILTRQTLYPWPCFLAAVLVERRLRERRGLGWIAIGIAIVALMIPTLLLAAATVREASNDVLLLAWKFGLESPRRALAMIVEHPLLAVRQLSPLVTIFGALGIVTVARRSSIRLSLVVSFAVMMLVTLPFVLPSRGVSWSFRLPLYALAVVLTGSGVAAFDRVITERTRWLRHRTLGLALGAALLGAIGRGTLDNRKPSAELAEYRALRTAFASMPSPFVAVTAGVRDPAPSDKLTESIASRFGVKVVGPEDSPPRGSWIFLEGLGCHAFSVIELFEESGTPGDERYVRMIDAALDPARGFGTELVQRPSSMRRECRDLEAKLVAGAHPPSIRDGPELVVEDGPPMVLFDAGRIRLRFFTSEQADSGAAAPSRR
jgi:hypothetical protein